MTNPKTPRDRDPSHEEKGQVTNPNRRQEEDAMKDESQRGGQRTKDKDYGSSESKPTDRKDEQSGRKENDPYRKH